MKLTNCTVACLSLINSDCKIHLEEPDRNYEAQPQKVFRFTNLFGFFIRCQGHPGIPGEGNVLFTITISPEMKIVQEKNSNELQPAIDTPCDNCGVIYDLLDCTTVALDGVLCPDCAHEHHDSATEENIIIHRDHYKIVPLFDPQNNVRIQDN